MESFNFERNQQPPQPLERLGVVERAASVATPEEVLGQLSTSEERYGDYLRNFREGDEESREYLEEMQANLLSWKHAFDLKFGKITPDSRDIYDEVLRRLVEVSDALEESPRTTVH